DNTPLYIPDFIDNPNEPPVIVAKNLVKRFGDFTAANNVSFTIQKGEIFGFLGSNGCGKSTTMKMLTGLLQADEGHATLFGQPVDEDDKATRCRVGYMSQAFSLYEELTVKQNLALTAAIYPTTHNKIKESVADALHRFDLIQYADNKPADLPLGIRQRLQLAAACIHRPELLILDEPTSGVDPHARDMFWRQLIELSRKDKTTIFVSTHFMNEAALCDRISLMHAGRVLAADTPENLRQRFQAATLEEAFIQCLEDNGANESAETAFDETIISEENQHKINPLAAWLATTLTFARRESLELLRDPMRLFFAAVGPLVILFCIALCISFDIDEVPFAVADFDSSLDSQKLVQEFESSPYFVAQNPLYNHPQIEEALHNNQAKLVIEIPPNFGKELNAGKKPQVAYHIDGTQPFTATAISGYIGGTTASHIANMLPEKQASIDSITEPRFIYNQQFKSIYAMTPAVLMMALLMIPTMLTAVGVVREKELGSILNFYTSPVSGSQYLIGKQLPYIALGFASGLILLFFIVFILGVPVKGSLIALLIGILLFVAVATAIGLFVSCFVNTQIAALFAAGILVMIPSVNFSGMIYPVATLEGAAAVIAKIFPASWFQIISIGTFTKGVGFSVLWKMYAVLALQLLLLMSLSVKLLKKWEK
ncbi:MAG: ABC transporter ATP-binding protein/permease, partial [Neisseriaceae bacterium]|nr:ABC transporter ATP-binding protein/permease [Neisseriaceae bacterium]